MSAAPRAVALLFALLGLVGCSLLPVNTEPLEMNASQGAWLRAGYAQGMSAPTTVDASLCGIRDGMVIHALPGGAGVEAMQIPTWERLWVVEGVTCSRYSLVGDHVVMFAAGQEPESRQLGLVEVATGPTRPPPSTAARA